MHLLGLLAQLIGQLLALLGCHLIELLGQACQILGCLIEARAAILFARHRLEITGHLIECSTARIRIWIELLLELGLSSRKIGKCLFLIAGIVAQALFEFGQLPLKRLALFRSELLILLNLLLQILNLRDCLIEGCLHLGLFTQHVILGIRHNS